MKRFEKPLTEHEKRDSIERLTPKDCISILEEVDSEFLSSEERADLIAGLTIEFSNSANSGVEKKEKSELRAKIAVPIFRGKRIASVEDIRNIIIDEYPGLADREDIAKLLRVVEFHVDISKQYNTGDLLPRGVCSKLEKEYNISHKEVRKILREGETPYLFSHLEKAFSARQAAELYSRILTSLNGVTDLHALDDRLSQYYLAYSLLKHKQYVKHRESTVNYFRFLDCLPQGGFCTDIARLADIGTWDVQRWALEEKKPRHIEIASQIPIRPSKTSHKWLPLTMKNDHVLGQFIEVPTEISSPTTILELLDNLPILRTRLMEKYEHDYGKVSKHLALMYSLGLMVSDGTFGLSVGGNSSYVSLTASKKYPWHNILGMGFCYCLGRLGISTQRYPDMVVGKNGVQYINGHWRSVSSPFLLWTKRELLGLASKTPKSNTMIQADWILKMPWDWRVTFIQGVADGDGWASTRGFNTGISTARNQDFIERIFQSLNIKSSKTPSTVVISNKEDIKKAMELPLFRHSMGRQKRLETLVAMSESVTGKWISGEEKEMVLNLSRRGLSGGEISEILWKEYGISRPPGTVNSYLKRRRSRGE